MTRSTSGVNILRWLAPLDGSARERSPSRSLHIAWCKETDRPRSLPREYPKSATLLTEGSVKRLEKFERLFFSSLKCWYAVPLDDLLFLVERALTGGVAFRKEGAKLSCPAKCHHFWWHLLKYQCWSDHVRLPLQRFPVVYCALSNKIKRVHSRDACKLHGVSKWCVTTGA